MSEEIHDIDDISKKILDLFDEKKWDEVIFLTTKIIQSNFDRTDIEFQMYSLRGFSYKEKGEYDRAISDISKAINLNPETPYLWKNRAYIYLFGKGEYKKARNDYKELITLSDDPSIHSVFYLLDRIDSFDQKLGKNIFSLYEIVVLIKSTLLIRVIDGYIVHYCSLDTLKKLATGEGFRLYNVDYMNDHEEGKTFFDLINESNFKVNEIFFRGKETEKSVSPAYIGSFVKIEKGGEAENLFFWKTYGKQEGVESSGACLVFKDDIFPTDYHLTLGIEGNYKYKNKYEIKTSSKAMDGSRSQTVTIYDTPEEFESALDILKQSGLYGSAPMLFNVVYRSDVDTVPHLKKHLKEITSILRTLQEEENTHDLVCEILDEIRFLFKADHYKEEKEARVIVVRPQGRMDQKSSDKIKIDTDIIPPRFYIEPFEGTLLERVILGPQVKRFAEWTEIFKRSKLLKNVEVKKSKIPPYNLN